MRNIVLYFIYSVFLAQLKWTTINNLVGEVENGFVSFSIGYKGYMSNLLRHTLSGSTTLNDFWEFNSSTNSWNIESTVHHASSWNAVGFSKGQKGYVGDENNFYVQPYC